MTARTTFRKFVAANRVHLGVAARDPVLEWAGEIQPVPLHRAKVVIEHRYNRRSHGYLPDADHDFRRELQQLWMVERVVRNPLRGDLYVAMTFAGCSVRRDAIGRRRHLPRPDKTNLEKAIEDAGNGFLWADDAQIRGGMGYIVEWSEEARPLVTIDVWRLGGNGGGP